MDETEPSAPVEVIEHPSYASQRAANVAAGKPFGGKLSAKEAAAKSVEVRRQKAAQRAREAKVVKVASNLKIKEAPSREELKGAALSVVHEAARMFLADPEKYARTGRELASVASVFFEILRLESNQSTSNVEHVSTEDKIRAIKEMQDDARRRAAANDAPIIE